MTSATANPAIDTLKKAFLIGLGATVLTAEKIKELANELVSRGEMSQEDAKSFGEELVQRALKEKEQFDAKIKETVDGYVQKTVDSLGLVTKADLDNLRNELRNQQG